MYGKFYLEEGWILIPFIKLNNKFNKFHNMHFHRSLLILTFFTQPVWLAGHRLSILEKWNTTMIPWLFLLPLYVVLISRYAL